MFMKGHIKENSIKRRDIPEKRTAISSDKIKPAARKPFYDGPIDIMRWRVRQKRKLLWSRICSWFRRSCKKGDNT